MGMVVGVAGCGSQVAGWIAAVAEASSEGETGC